MSIENELSKLTDAILKLAGAVAAQEAPQPAAEAKSQKASKPKAEKAPEPEPPAAEEPSSAAPSDEPAATVDDVREATKQLAALSRDAAVAVLKQFGASKVPEVKEADYGAFVAAAQAKAKELS